MDSQPSDNVSGIINFRGDIGYSDLYVGKHKLSTALPIYVTGSDPVEKTGNSFFLKNQEKSPWETKIPYVDIYI